MCVVSMVMDHYHNKWKPYVVPSAPIYPWPTVPVAPQPSPITPAEIEEFRRLLDRAREYDRRNNEPDCELESKKKAVRDIAEALGVKIDFL